MSLYYVYILCRPNGKVKGKLAEKVFYVGKGQNSRVYDHDREARTGHACHKCNVIRKVWREGGQLTRYILFETDNEQAALGYERDMIAMYGRGTLTNQSEGGEGLSGTEFAPEECGRRREYAMKMWRDPKMRAKMVSGIIKGVRRAIKEHGGSFRPRKYPAPAANFLDRIEAMMPDPLE